MTEDEVKHIVKKQFDYFAAELQAVETYKPEDTNYRKQWEHMKPAPNDITVWDTGLNWDLLSFIGRASVYYPPEFVN
jgi:hypothetical protein